MAAATLSLLQWKPLKYNPARNPIQPPPSDKSPAPPRPLRLLRPCLSCCLPSMNSALIPGERKRDDTVGALGALEALKKPAVAAALLLSCNVSSALAATSYGPSSPSSVSSSSRPRSPISSTRSPFLEWGYSQSTTYYGPSPARSPVLESGYSYSTAYYVPSLSEAGPILFLIISMGFAAFLSVSGLGSDRRSESEKTSALKIQVGLQGTVIKSLQKDLDRIAEVADTSTPSGLSFVLTEAILALLRHPDYCISGYTTVDMKRSKEDVEKRFNELCLEERGKFGEGTLVGVNNIRKQSSTARSSDGISDEHIVITILVAAEGVHKFPAINGIGDLKEALQKLGSIPSRKLLAVEVLWTPQNDNGTLSERELLEDYPLLRPL